MATFHLETDDTSPEFLRNNFGTSRRVEERLWFKTMGKLRKLYFDREEFNRILEYHRQSSVA
jgi:hypothetical protein